MLPRCPHQAPHEQARAGRLISIGGPGQEFDCCIQVDFLECDIVDGFTGDAITDQKDGLRCHGSCGQQSINRGSTFNVLHVPVRPLTYFQKQSMCTCTAIVDSAWVKGQCWT